MLATLRNMEDECCIDIIFPNMFDIKRVWKGNGDLRFRLESVVWPESEEGKSMQDCDVVSWLL
jgi:hypothetical protein